MSGLRGYKSTGDVCHFKGAGRGKPVLFMCKYSKGKIMCAKCRELIKGESDKDE